MDGLNFSLTLFFAGVGTYASVKIMNATLQKRWEHLAILMMVIGGIGSAYYYFVLSGAEAGDSKKSSVDKSTHQDRPMNSPSISGDHNTTIYNLPSTKKEQDEPTTLGKYVCATNISSRSGKPGLLIEFGIRRGQTTGLAFHVALDSPYLRVMDWTQAPLRTDMPGIAMMQKSGWETRRDPSQMSYSESFAEPSLTPRKSYYLYFESEKPPRITDLSFVEEQYALSDQLRTNAMAKQFDTCPR